MNFQKKELVMKFILLTISGKRFLHISQIIKGVYYERTIKNSKKTLYR